MRFLILSLLLLTVSCDPGARFRLIDGNGAIASWAVADDSVRGTVNASAFTIDLSVQATLDAPADVTLLVDSASVMIRDVDGVPLQIDRFTNYCDDSIPPAPLRSKRCVFGRVNLHSTNYDRLDSVSVRFGYAITGEHRLPLVARFVRAR
jgi:hypothetical protein